MGMVKAYYLLAIIKCGPKCLPISKDFTFKNKFIFITNLNLKTWALKFPCNKRRPNDK